MNGMHRILTLREKGLKIKEFNFCRENVHAMYIYHFFASCMTNGLDRIFF